MVVEILGLAFLCHWWRRAQAKVLHCNHVLLVEDVCCSLASCPARLGEGGTYKLDEYGDRDVAFSVIYTTKDNKVR